MQSKAIPLSRRIALLTPEQRSKFARLCREAELAGEAEYEREVHEKFFAIGQHAAIALMRPHDARELAKIDRHYIDNWHPVPAYGWGFPLYASTHNVTDPGDVCRADVECFVEKLLGSPYPEPAEVCAFIEGVADVVGL
ncbi:hypothetical protein [Paraburkholderia sp. JHI869]|uniref:hypothetical protein n=1 Tax=Paraburkholderia sp. JHI869 TaxID=3112959 RepID=UPI00317B501C